jgi:hypothetical protein
VKKINGKSTDGDLLSQDTWGRLKLTANFLTKNAVQYSDKGFYSGPGIVTPFLLTNRKLRT